MGYLIAGLIGVLLLLLGIRGIAWAVRRIDPLFRYNKQGLTHLDEGRYDEAISQFTQAAAVAPEEPASYYNRGLAHHRKGEQDRAIADFYRALDVNPGYASAYFGRGL